MNSPDNTPRTSFRDVFYARLDEIKRRGKAVGLTLTDICRQSGIARATPDRWRDEAPMTIELVDRMDAVVTQAEEAAAGRA